MKKTLILLSILTAFVASAQSIEISPNGGTNASAILDLKSTTKGFLLPRMTNDQMRAIPSPAQGLLAFCTDCGTNGDYYFYKGTDWVALGSTTVSVSTTVGSVSDNADEKGATITNGVLNLAPANATKPGIITATDQTFGGVKTFSNGIVGNVTGDLNGNAGTATRIASITYTDIVQLTSTQTLTNKTLTSPTITGTGAIAGIFTGDLTGNVTGNITGNALTATTATTATNISGGAAGSIPYQTGTGTTSLLAAGSSGQVLTSSGLGTLTWANASSGIPYTGATAAVNLGAYDLTVNGITVGMGAGGNYTNTAVGASALQSNIQGGIGNTAIGSYALNKNTTGLQNTANGDGALFNNSTGSENTANGVYALRRNTTGNYNTANGSYALFNNMAGDNNTAYGKSALVSNFSGSNNTAIGYEANVASGALTNATAIGNGASVNASNKIQLGNSSVTAVQLGTADKVTLETGYVKITGGTPSAGKVLTSDADGLASWATPSSSGVDLTTAQTIAGVKTFLSAPVLSSTTASKALFTDANKNIVSNEITGTGNVVMSNAPALTGTLTAANQTLSGTLGVGTSSPNTSAKVEVDATNKGVLLPRVTLSGSTDATTIATPATSLLVYNTATVSDVVPGYYYNSGTSGSPVWVRLNAGTLPITNGGTGATTASDALTNLGAAPIASPTFTGDPRAPTATTGTNTTQLATTAFVHAATLANTAELSDRINGKLSSNWFDFPPIIQRGHIMYWIGYRWVILNPGTAGQVLKMSSDSDPVPVWGTDATTPTTAFYPCGTTITDIDGNAYNTVLIGDQCWTKENLRVTKYNDGTAIPFDATGGSGGSSSTWQNLTTGARAVYANDFLSTPSNLTKYGYLYNWYAAKGIITAGGTSTKNICPSGWHVPTDEEWTTLTTDLGGENVAGGKMKSIGTAYWNSTNTGATNESGFSALPGGFRLTNGSFNNLRYSATFWRATEVNANNAWSSRLDYNSSNVSKNSYEKQYGASIRCLKD
jgi:uncharacterized protein (TIGR02145 family)